MISDCTLHSFYTMQSCGNQHAMYFSTNPLFDTPLIQKFMSYDRFCLIEKLLHFVNNSNLPKHFSKKAKFEPTYYYLVNKFKTLYVPNKNISIDE